MTVPIDGIGRRSTTYVISIHYLYVFLWLPYRDYSAKRQFSTSQVPQNCSDLSSLKTRLFSMKQSAFGSHLTIE